MMSHGVLSNFPENKNGIKDTRVFRIKERDELKQLVARYFIQKQWKCMLNVFHL
jgi:hypothetical protein